MSIVTWFSYIETGPYSREELRRSIVKMNLNKIGYLNFTARHEENGACCMERELGRDREATLDGAF